MSQRRFATSNRSDTLAVVDTIKRRDEMYMMEKLDAYKQEIERLQVLAGWNEQRLWARKNLEDKDDLLIRYAHEMLRIHDDLKKYCNALLIKAQEHNSAVDRTMFEYRKLNEDYIKLDKKYKALRKKVVPVKKPAAKKVAKPKGT
jgi:thiamine kinase-like enzyme